VLLIAACRIDVRLLLVVSRTLRYAHRANDGSHRHDQSILESEDMTTISRHAFALSVRVVGTLMLVLAALTACSSKHLTAEERERAEVQAYEAQIRKVVADPARADQLVALTNEFQQQAEKSVAAFRDYRAKVAALNSNYEATREQFQALLSQQDTHRELWTRKVTGLRQRMAALTTDLEWERLKKARLRIFEADLQDLAS
jgi:hypothetical protein